MAHFQGESSHSSPTTPLEVPSARSSHSVEKELRGLQATSAADGHPWWARWTGKNGGLGVGIPLTMYKQHPSDKKKTCKIPCQVWPADGFSA
jgi:hypothetical protein